MSTESPAQTVPFQASTENAAGGDLRLYFDVAAFLDGRLPAGPSPRVLQRTDGIGLFYSGQVNYLFGDPESGKTWIAMGAVVEALQLGQPCLIVDLDHNGASATLARLIALGVDPDVLSNLDQFRYCEPEDSDHLTGIVRDCLSWRPTIVVIDSIGELLPMLRLSSNNPDDFTAAHASALHPFAGTGAAVIAIDHLAKNSDSRAQGASGTAAKRRAIGGTSLRVTVKEPFTPGRGGSCILHINKDRHGGLRAHSPADRGEPSAGTFELIDLNGDLSWTVHSPGGTALPAPGATEADLATLDDLDPPPRSQRDIKERLNWGSTRAASALRTWKARQPPDVPRSPTPM